MRKNYAKRAGSIQDAPHRHKTLYRCWRLCCILPLIIMAFIATTTTAQQVYLGTAPVQTPVNGFAVDANAYANYVPGDTIGEPDFGVAGDWFYVPHWPEFPPFDTILWEGPGRGILRFDGPIYPDMTTVYVDSISGDPDYTTFLEKTKIDENPNTYTWGEGNVPPKNEIQNVAVHFTYGDPALGGDPDDLWCLFAADRMVTNGSSYIDFEFLQDSLLMTTNADGDGIFTSEGPDFGRNVGDLLVTVELTNGGAVANVILNKWSVGGKNGFEYHTVPIDSFPENTIYATNNNEITYVPFRAYDQIAPDSIQVLTGLTLYYYDINQWVEGAVNLSALFNLDENPCFTLSTVFVRTRSSGSSATSQLKDIPGPPIQLGIDFADLEVFAPDPVSLGDCLEKEAVRTQFEAWLDGFYFTGGVPAPGETEIESNLAEIQAHAAEFDAIWETIKCGGTVSYTLTVDDYCDDPIDKTSSFTLADAAPLVLSDCPGDPNLEGCSTEGEIGTAWDLWIAGLESMTETGGCSDGVVVFDPPLDQLVSPVECDPAEQVITVTAIAESYCFPTIEKTCTFTVQAYPDDLTLDDCPGDPMLDGCSPQSEITSAWNDWMAGLMAMTEGGTCSDGVVVFDPPLASLVMPEECVTSDQVVNVTAIAEDHCNRIATPCSFTVYAYPDDLTLDDCPGDPMLDGCSPQSEITSAWNDWMAGLMAMTEGGTCSDGVVVFDPPLESLVMPEECVTSDQVVNVTAIAEDHCNRIATPCSFTVYAYPDDLTLDDCPGDPMLDGCTPQSEITSAWNDWMAGLMAMTEGGTCSDGVVVFDPPLESLVMPEECVTSDQVVNVTAIAEDHCNKIETPCSFTVYAYPDDLTLDDCPGDPMLDGCSPQSEITSAWNDWMAGLMAMTEGGTCSDGEVVFDPPLESLVMPEECVTSDQVVNVTAIAEDHCNKIETPCSFTVYAYPDDLTLDDCPGDPMLDGCSPQSEITSAWNDWMAGLMAMTEGGTCSDGVVVFDPPLASLVMPEECVTSDQVVNVTAIAEDHCNKIETPCSFTVYAYPDDLTLDDCPGDPMLDGCSPQSEITSAWNDWMAGLMAMTEGGTCSDGVVVFDPPLASLVMPEECVTSDQVVNVTAIAEDHCNKIETPCSFTVYAYPDDLTLDDCPGDPMLDGCSPQSEITSAWNDWMAGLMAMTEGGTCSDGVVVFDPPLASLVMPEECVTSDQVVNVTAIAEDHCNKIETPCSFTVYAYPDDLTLDDCPGDPMLDGCSPQSEITSAWNDWMAGLMAMTEGGTCSDGVVVFDPPLESLVMPEECVTSDQVVNVTAIAEDHCNRIATPCSFTVYAYPDDLTLDDCPGDPMLDGCTPQSEIASAWNDWVNGLMAMTEGGTCSDGVVVFDPPLESLVMPEECVTSDQVVNVTAIAEDHCNRIATPCSFTMYAYTDPVDAYCEPGPVLGDCLSEAEYDIAFQNWKDGFGYTGGCEPVTTNQAELDALDWRNFGSSETGYYVSFTFTAEDHCTSDQATCDFYIPPCDVCETAYGYLAGASSSFLSECGDGGSWSNWGWSIHITEEGEYRIPMYAATPVCDPGSEWDSHVVDTAVVTYSGGNITVDFLEMYANYSLDANHIWVGTTTFPEKIAPGQWPYVEGDNIPFSGGYIVIHGVYCGPPLPTVITIKEAQITEPVLQESELKVYPNPFTEKVTFEFVSGRDAYGVLDIYNITGQKVARILDRPVEAGVMNRIEYEPEHGVTGMYLYRLDLDGKLQIGRIIYKE